MDWLERSSFDVFGFDWMAGCEESKQRSAERGERLLKHTSARHDLLQEILLTLGKSLVLPTFFSYLADRFFILAFDICLVKWLFLFNVGKGVLSTPELTLMSCVVTMNC